MFNSFKVQLPAMLAIALLFTFSFTSCEDDGGPETPDLRSMEYDYDLHNGQTVPSAPYGGSHSTDFAAKIEIMELANGKAMVKATLMNTIEGETYHIHSHDAADASTTPNGTPYDESPNGDVLVQMLEGNGATVTASQESTMSYDELTGSYDGFFVVHDPLQAISTTDISTYLVVGSFARTQPESNYASATFTYGFNTGLVAEIYTYAGNHDSSFSSMIQVDELAENRSRITVRHMNTMDGETYHTHAHDMADPLITLNGTPYIEAPNMGVFAAPIEGNGGTASSTQVSDMSYSDITTSYDGFFVVHDPLQSISTIDPTTYVILGVFAR